MLEEKVLVLKMKTINAGVKNKYPVKIRVFYTGIYGLKRLP